ncbi:MAG: histidinol dehydrogenase [Lachnospiraceae bacterium]|nr:histidinol dehydrogenase [Lachnospiraceae bacterium]
MRILPLTPENKANLLNDLLKRSPNHYASYMDTVQAIVERVRAEGDRALVDYTAQFDHFAITPAQFLVTEEEIEDAYRQLDTEFLAVLRKARENIRSYHEKQRRYSWFDPTPGGSLLGQKVTPLERVGVYVPGGKAAYPSSVLMNVLPARVAGVGEVIMVTPPGQDGKVNPGTLAAAREAGVDRIYKIGGAQAIAALAFGTETIPKADKIVGPGNIFVALAKKAVFGYVSIDSIAGPSEILVLADKTANPRYAAADLLSQAEHDELASAILVTTSDELARRVSVLVHEMAAGLSRREIIEKSLENYGYILVAPSMDEALEVVNEIASEHMEIMTKDAFSLLPKIRNAGAIFIGEYSSEPLGDYFAGPNHVLPTNGTAKFFSPLSVDDFIKKSSIISYTKDDLQAVWPQVVRFAEEEGLTAHAHSIRVRFEEGERSR